MDGEHPCQLFDDAAHQAILDYERDEAAARQKMMDAVEAAIRCHEEHPEQPPAPMAMAEPSKRMRIESHAEEIRACVAAIVRIVKE